MTADLFQYHVLMIAQRIIVSGVVQGVGFRAWTQREAQRLRLVGWVRNLEDGLVEAFLQGESVQVESMIELCKRGPKYAKVTNIERRQELVLGELFGFSILE